MDSSIGVYKTIITLHGWL